MEDFTLDYYNQKAQAFVDGTRYVEFHPTQNKFLNYLKPGSRILDLGCGSGRDSKYFLEKGFLVDAADGAEELVRLASEFTGIKVRQMLFQELDSRDVYDGVWTCASLLHVTVPELRNVFGKIWDSLKDNGVFYTSFKYGEFEGIRTGRYFTDMTEDGFREFLKGVPDFDINEMWVTSDVRKGREEEKWLNIILSKNSLNQIRY